MTTEAHPLDWTEEPREGRGPSFIASADGVKIGFVSDRGEEFAGPARCRWKVWPSDIGADCAAVEDGKAAVADEWARVNEPTED